MDHQKIWDLFQSLPMDKQREVADFIEFLAGRIAKPVKRRKPKRKISEEPAVGMWKDREDMKDPVQWVRNLRRKAWGPR